MAKPLVKQGCFDADDAGAVNSSGIFLNSDLVGSADAISGVITPPSGPGTPRFGTYYINPAVGIDAITLTLPAATEDGNVIEFIDFVGRLHTVTTATGGIKTTAGAKQVGTFSGNPLAALVLQAKGGQWVVQPQTLGITFS